MSPPQSPWGPDDWPENPSLVLSQRRPTPLEQQMLRAARAQQDMYEEQIRRNAEQIRQFALGQQRQINQPWVAELNPMVPPQSLPEGWPPRGISLPPPQPVVSADPLMREIERLEENTRRQQGGLIDPVASRQENARKALGRALNEAVESGYMAEGRAVAMIVAGGLNDRPMQPEGAREQLVRALAQAVRSNALDRATADSIAAMIGGVQPASRPSQGRTRPIAEPTECADPLASRDELIYEALILRPCHNSEHENAHRTSVWVCDQQAALAWATLLDGLAIDASLLPRQLHLDEAGERKPCCRSDGNIGTWLRWGRMTDPGLS